MVVVLVSWWFVLVVGEEVARTHVPDFYHRFDTHCFEPCTNHARIQGMRTAFLLLLLLYKVAKENGLGQTQIGS